MSKIEVDAIDKQSGSTLTLGGSGTAVTLASGATQSGFGRTGTVNWVTTKKTTGFTAVSGEGYFCDTAASGAFTLTLPASPSAGDIVGFKDYNGNFATANLTIGRNSQPINGANTADPVINIVSPMPAYINICEIVLAFSTHLPSQSPADPAIITIPTNTSNVAIVFNISFIFAPLLLLI